MGGVGKSFVLSCSLLVLLSKMTSLVTLNLLCMQRGWCGMHPSGPVRASFKCLMD